MSTLKFKNIDGCYEEELELDGQFYARKTTDTYLYVLTSIFNEGNGWTNAVKITIEDQDSEGITGENMDITNQDNKVIIQALHTSNTAKYTIEIERHELLNIINKWQELTAQDCKEITFTRHEDGAITLTGE